VYHLLRLDSKHYDYGRGGWGSSAQNLKGEEGMQDVQEPANEDAEMAGEGGDTSVRRPDELSSLVMYNN
jgi:hypothetical protein